jgi:hypothetical protein
VLDNPCDFVDLKFHLFLNSLAKFVTTTARSHDVEVVND